MNNEEFDDCDYLSFSKEHMQDLLAISFQEGFMAAKNIDYKDDDYGTSRRDKFVTKKLKSIFK